MSWLIFADGISTQNVSRKDVALMWQRQKKSKVLQHKYLHEYSYFPAGISTNKTTELITSIGLIPPTMTRLCENYQKLKLFTMGL